MSLTPALLLAISYRWCHCHQRLIILSVVDTGHKLIAGVNENPGQGLIPGVKDDTGGVADTGEQLIDGVTTPAFVDISVNFCEFEMDAQGPRETDSWKKSWKRKSCVRLILRMGSSFSTQAFSNWLAS